MAPAAAPAGWYPDTTRPGMQRYWDGAQWTNHMAPLAGGATPTATTTIGAPKQSRSIEVGPRLIVGVIGALIAFIAAFLPHAESDEVLTIANNTLMSNGDGIFVVLLAIGGGVLAVLQSGKQGPSVALGIIGVVTLLLGIFEGTDSALKVVNGLGQEVETTAGPAVWSLCLGGIVMAIAGFVPWRTQKQQ